MKVGFEFGEKDHHEDVISDINITPLVDVMLLLMIIFLVTAPLMVNNLNVNLPKAAGHAETKTVSKVIVIKETGEIYFEEKMVSIEEISAELKALSSADSQLTIKIAADENSRYQDVALVLSTLSKNNVSNISFVTKN